MKIFGSGYAFATPTFDAAGNALALGARTILGINKEIDLDISFSIKELVGQQQTAEDVARGAMKIGGKIKFASIFGAAWDGLFFGQPGQLTTGTLKAVVAAIAATPIPVTPFTITVTPPNSGTFVADVCVINAATGVPMTQVASGPVAGQYSVNTGTGVYTFSSADNTAGVSVFINYQYSASVAGSYSQDVQFLPMGYSPFFSLQHTVQHAGKQLTLLLPKCTSSKLALGLKNEDHLVPELDFVAMRDPATNKVMTWSTSE